MDEHQMTHDQIKALVMKASYYIDNDMPLKDVMTDSQIEECIRVLADVFYVTGTMTYNGEDL